MPLFMPPSAVIHYRSAFNVKSEEEGLSEKLRRIVRGWCQSRRDVNDVGREELSHGWFFSGDAEQHVCGECHIRTASNKGKYCFRDPEHWAFELIHPDQNIHSRLWSVNIGITRVDDATIRFACLLQHGVRTNYVGPQFDTPPPSVPKFIRDVLENEKFECFKRESKINPRLYDVGIFGGKWIAEQICNTQRRLPILIYVQSSNTDMETKFDSLAKKNIGNANCYIISSTVDLNEFNSNVPYDHRLAIGMMRVYFRYSISPETGFRHKFYLEHELRDNLRSIDQEITFALSQNALSFMPEEIVEIKHVIEKRRLSNIFEMREQKTSRDNAEYIQLLDAELDEKIQEIALKDEKMLQLEISLEAEQEKAKDLSWKATQYVGCMKDKESLEGSISSLRQEFDIPRSLCEVLSLATLRWNDSILIHENAYRSAQQYEHAEDMRIVQEAWKMINKLALVMHNLKFLEKSNDLETIFRKTTGIDFSMTESKTTKKDAKFAKMRKCTWNNADVIYYPHLKSAVKDDFRLHFSFLEEERKILICHCGKHLDNAKTRHLD